jgi:hypothetical protein
MVRQLTINRDYTRNQTVTSVNAGYDSHVATARCVLRDLSRNGRIRLIVVRYDEGERHGVRENLQEKLASSTGPRQ